MITGRQSVGWAESPLQLLALAEAHATGVLDATTTAIPRRDVTGLAATAGAIAELGLPEGFRICDPGDVVPGRSQLLAVGDALSGAVQRSLVFGNHDGIVVVDDGLATVELVRRLVNRKSLIRARAQQRTPRGLARWYLGRLAVRALLTAADEGRLAIFTAMSLPEELDVQASARGIKVQHHEFRWLRSKRLEAGPDERTVVLGSSLANDGLIAADRYLSWVLDHADREPIAFYPHRREDSESLTTIARHPNVRIERTDLPVELSLRCLHDDQRVVSLPSTAVVSLGLLHSGSGARVDLTPVPDEWWTRNASGRFRRNLASTISG